MGLLTAIRASRATAAFAAAGFALTAVYFVVPTGTPANVVYDTVGIGAFLAILAGVRSHRPETRVPWILFALGNLSFAVADMIFDALADAPVPSVADWFYLGGYPLLAVALAALVVHAGGHHRVAGLIEVAIVTVAFLLFQWVFVVDRIVDGSGPTGQRAVAAAYPLMDVLLLAGFAGFFVTAAWRTPAFVLLVGSIAAMLVGDEVYGLSPSTYSSGDWPDACWLVSYILFGAAALHPSMRLLSRPRRRPTEVRVSPARILLLVAALLTAPAVLLVRSVRDARLDIWAVVGAGAIISVLVVARLVGILRALERTRARLIEADRLKDEFVALISHDLRTPLTSIMGYVELALDDNGEPDLDPERRRFLEIVSRSAYRLMRLVDDLLFVARIQAGRLDLRPSLLDLSTVARQAVEEAQQQAAAKGVELRFTSEGPVEIEADKGRMFQMLDNLVSNAIKFTPEGGRIEIGVVQEGAALLEIRDTGVGFTEDEASRLFERFYRTSNAVEAQVPGTGLGLFIAHAIADAHGGRISAIPREGGGAVFRIELPRTRGAVPQWQTA